MISNFFERESSDKKPIVVPCKKKRKFSCSKSRKRPRTKTQCDNIEPKVKKSRKIEQPESSTIETINENKPLQHVSVMINVNTNIIN